MRVPKAAGPMMFKKVAGFPPNKFVKKNNDKVTKLMSSSDYHNEDGAMISGGY